MKAKSGHVAIVVLAGTALGLLAPEPGPKPKPPSESARIKALPEEDRQWLTEFVAAIILDEEKKAFLEIQATYQREVFKREFWERRELPDLPAPLGPGYRFRYQELRQLADEKYDGWRQEAGRMVLRWGEPASILKPTCGGEDVFDVEVWTYNNLGQGGRTSARYIFYRPYLKRPRRLWTLNDSDAQVFYPNSCRRKFSDLARDCPHSLPDLGHCVPCDDRCEVYKAYAEISSRQGSFAGAAIEQATLFEPPKVSTEGLDRQKNRWATSSHPGAKKIQVEGPSAAADDVAASATPTPTPMPEPRRRLSAEEIRERIFRLEPKYRDWLDIAKPLLTEDELSRFLQLSAPERDRFIREFWKRHS